MDVNLEDEHMAGWIDEFHCEVRDHLIQAIGSYKEYVDKKRRSLEF